MLSNIFDQKLHVKRSSGHLYPNSCFLAQATYEKAALGVSTRTFVFLCTKSVLVDKECFVQSSYWFLTKTSSGRFYPNVLFLSTSCLTKIALQTCINTSAINSCFQLFVFCKSSSGTFIQTLIFRVCTSAWVYVHIHMHVHIRTSTQSNTYTMTCALGRTPNGRQIHQTGSGHDGLLIFRRQANATRSGGIHVRFRFGSVCAFKPLTPPYPISWWVGGPTCAFHFKDQRQRA